MLFRSQLVDASTLKPEIVSGLDIMIVRELTGGIYFGEPRGIKPIENGERKGINTHTYTSSEIIRVARIAFDLAKKRSNKVTSLSKIKVNNPKNTTAAQPKEAIIGIFLSTNKEIEIEITVAITKIPVPHKIPRK